MNRFLKLASIVGTWALVGLFAWLVVVAATRQDTTAENTSRTRQLAEQAVAQAKRDACDMAAFRLYPDALSNPPNLTKLIRYQQACYVLNHVQNTAIIKLPPPPE